MMTERNDIDTAEQANKQTAPEWKVINMRGKVICTVFGLSRNDAKQSFEEDPRFYGVHAYRIERI